MSAVEALVALEPGVYVTFHIEQDRARRFTIPAHFDGDQIVEYLRELGIDIRPTDEHALLRGDLHIVTRTRW